MTLFPKTVGFWKGPQSAYSHILSIHRNSSISNAIYSFLLFFFLGCEGIYSSYYTHILQGTEGGEDFYHETTPSNGVAIKKGHIVDSRWQGKKWELFCWLR